MLNPFYAGGHLPEKSLTYDFHTLLVLKPDESSVSSPGITAIFSLIPDLLHAVHHFAAAVRHQDTEQIAEHLIRVLNLPLGIASAVERLVSFLLLIIAGISYVTLSIAGTSIGLVFLGIELALEIWRLLRTITFSFNHHIKTAKKLLSALRDPSTQLDVFLAQNGSKLLKFVTPSELNKAQYDAKQLRSFIVDKILKDIYRERFTLSKDETELILHKAEASAEREKHFITDPIKLREHKEAFLRSLIESKMQNKLNSFARRADPWLVKKFHTELAPIMENPNHSVVPLLSGERLLDNLSQQINKTLCIHIIGITAILFAITSLIFSLVLFPPALPIIFAVAGVGIEVVRLFARKAFLSHPGWSWDWKTCIPFRATPRHVTWEYSDNRFEMVEKKDLSDTERGALALSNWSFSSLSSVVSSSR